MSRMMFAELHMSQTIQKIKYCQQMNLPALVLRKICHPLHLVFGHVLSWWQFPAYWNLSFSVNVDFSKKYSSVFLKLTNPISHKMSRQHFQILHCGCCLCFENPRPPSISLCNCEFCFPTHFLSLFKVLFKHFRGSTLLKLYKPGSYLQIP